MARDGKRKRRHASEAIEIVHRHPAVRLDCLAGGQKHPKRERSPKVRPDKPSRTLNDWLAATSSVPEALQPAGLGCGSF